MRIYAALMAFAMLVFITSCNSNKKNVETSDESQITDSHTSQNALDWEGTYQGTLPCADCQGIKTTIILNKNLAYTIIEKYIGKEASLSDAIIENYLGKESSLSESKGSFKWSDDGSKVILSDANRNVYFVGENTLTKLDSSGKKIEGNLANLYIFKKLNTNEIAFTDIKWKLVTLFGKEVKDSKAFISFATEDNRFFGNNSCNNFNGTFEVKDGSQLKLSEAATTMMACPDMTTEKQFMEVLNTADNFSLNRNTMTLNKARMAPLAVFEAEE